MSPPHYSTGNPVHDMQSVLRDSGCIPIDCPDDVSWAIAAPQHRAGRKPSHVSLSRPFGLPSAIAASLGERLVFFFRCIGARLNIIFYAVAAFAALYFAFELGRGVL